MEVANETAYSTRLDCYSSSRAGIISGGDNAGAGAGVCWVELVDASIHPSSVSYDSLIRLQ